MSSILNPQASVKFVPSALFGSYLTTSALEFYLSFTIEPLIKCIPKHVLFVLQNAQGIQAGIESATIEQKYQEFAHERGESVIEFVAGRHRYKLDFTIMKQANVRFCTSRLVRRRPKFVSMAERQEIYR